MKPFISIFSILFLAAVALSSCFEFSEKTLYGTWTIDSLSAENITEYATVISERNLEEFERQEEQINLMLDTIADGDMKFQLEMSLQQMEGQKAELSPENIEKEIIKQNKDFAGNFMMAFSNDHSFYIINKDDNDTLQTGSWEMTEDYIITTIPMMPEPDTMFISNTGKNHITLSQESRLTEDFSMRVFYHMSKE